MSQMAEMKLWGVLTLPWLVAMLGAFAAAGLDARTRRIPNLITLPMLAAGLTYGAVAGEWGGCLARTWSAIYRRRGLRGF